MITNLLFVITDTLITCGCRTLLSKDNQIPSHYKQLYNRGASSCEYYLLDEMQNGVI